MPDATASHYASPLGVTAYDVIYPDSEYGADVRFYRDCAAEFGGPVVEFGVGTGRIALALAGAGIDVVGVDISPGMLARASEKHRLRGPFAGSLELVEGSMTDADLGRQFAFVIVAARSFQHVLTPEAQRATLVNLRRHLKPGGHLAMALFDPRHEFLAGADEPPGTRIERADPPTGTIFRRTVIARDYDHLRQHITERLRLERLAPDRRVLDSEEVGWTLRWSVRQEIAYLFELTGFEVLAEYADFDRAPPRYGAEQIWIARAV